MQIRSRSSSGEPQSAAAQEGPRRHHGGRCAEWDRDGHAGECHILRDADEDEGCVVPPLEELVDELFREDREHQAEDGSDAGDEQAFEKDLREDWRTGKPISRSTPTVSRRSSTSMIGQRRRNTVAAMMVTTAIARWKRSSTRKGPADPAASPEGSASTPGSRAFTSFANCCASSGLTRATFTDAMDSAPTGTSVERVIASRSGRCSSDRSRNLTEPRGIRCGFVDACDAEFSGRVPDACGRETDDGPDREPFGFGKLAGDQDVWRRGRVLCRTGSRCQPEAEDDDGPNDRRERHERLRASIRAHSASVTGMTDSLAMRTSGNEAKLLSALISASVTGRFSRLVRNDVNDREFSRGVGGIGIGVTCRFRDRDHRLLLARVVVEDAVAAPDRAQVFLGERVSDACPDRLAFLLELVVP